MPELERRNFVLRLRQLASATLGLAITLTSVAVMSQPAQAQTFKVLYSFTGGSDGGEPDSGLIVDSAGNLYGSTTQGGVSHGQAADGVVFEVGANGGESVLTTFSRLEGGAGNPLGTLARDSPGNLYGVTENSGTNGGGTVFEVFATGGMTALHIFDKGGPGDGAHPEAGVILDKKGNLYGTTGASQSSGGFGVVFKLHIKPRRETILHTFTGKGGDGIGPSGALVRDSKGRLYGTAAAGGSYSGVCGSIGGCGIVFRIGTTGKETVLYTFAGGADGISPRGNLIRDTAGNLYGTTPYGGSGDCQNAPYTGCGIVYKVDKAGNETVLYTFMGGTDGALPYAGLVRDTAGNFYGTTFFGGGTGCQSQLGCGTVFKLDTSGKETVLYHFTGGADGEGPYAELLLDSKGNLYGTTLRGAGGDKKICSLGCGVVFKLTP
jgi:uncharacterized repeat protein (TIGR03803 family)